MRLYFETWMNFGQPKDTHGSTWTTYYRTKFNEKKPLQTKQHTHNTTYTISKQSLNNVLNTLNIL
jgi:hypothetical protein